MVYHVLNRGVGRMRLFAKEGDYLAFERVMGETLQLRPMRLLAYCLMPNHWHLVLWPREDGQLGAFMQRLGITHVRRWQEHRHAVGTGHVASEEVGQPGRSAECGKVRTCEGGRSQIGYLKFEKGRGTCGMRSAECKERNAERGFYVPHSALGILAFGVDLSLCARG